MSKMKEEFRNCFLGDLPTDIRDKVMNIHKVVSDIANTTFNSKKYFYLNKQDWAKRMLEEFLTVPSDKSQVGSVRLFKKGKRYRCMIQLTGHVSNTRNTEDEEFFHGMIRNIHHAARGKVRKKYDMKLECESEHGEPFEGFDLWTKQKVAKELWEFFDDKNIKTVSMMKESTEGNMVLSLEELPPLLQDYIERANDYICDRIKTRKENIDPLFLDRLSGYTEEADAIGFTTLRYSDQCNGSIQITPSIYDDGMSVEVLNEMDELFGDIFDESFDHFEDIDTTKHLAIQGNQDEKYFEFHLDSEYTRKLWDYLTENTNVTDKRYPKKKMVIKENADPEYNVDMSELQAKRTLRTLSQDIINKTNDGSDYKINQYTADIYSNIITKNLLPSWARGYTKFHIILDSYQSMPVFEFKPPKMTQDFVSRYVNGRENLNGLLHRNSEIKIKMSPRIFHTMKNPDDAYNFFKAAIKYYDNGVIGYSEKLTVEIMKMNRELKYLVSTTKLSGLVVYPLQMLFVFDDVNMSDKNTFKISSENIKAINNFIRTVYTRYAAPNKEKQKVLEDLQKTIDAFKESCDPDGNIRELTTLPEVVREWYDGKYNQEIQKFKEDAINEEIDTEWCYHNTNKEIKYLQEKFGVKKLKKIPADLVAYITIEAESIKDSTDKMMIASYCISKIEIVEWYIELLEVGSKKYIVPHSKPYLERVRTQLLACYKKIMDTPINNNKKELIDRSKYPAGYEG